LPGRVVRLHFQCRAALPIGSFLRVTGSSLSGPGSSSSSATTGSNAMMHSDPTEATASEMAVSSMEGNSNSSGTGSLPSESFMGTATSGGGGLYTSSVEMVTTPETYPLWRTRTPVIVVLNRRHSTIKQRVQHHYYRYLVIAPGMSSTNNINSTSTLLHESEHKLTVSTSSEYMGSTIVRQWEDPYQNNTDTSTSITNDTSTAASCTSFVSDAATSVASFVSQTKDGEHGMVSTWNDYLNLPYRTLDIDLTQLDQLQQQQQHAMDTTNGNGHVVTVPLDTWNDADDDSFQPYLIREAVRTKTLLAWLLLHTENARLVCLAHTIFLFCFHRSMWKIAKRLIRPPRNSHRSLSSTRQMISWILRMNCHLDILHPNRRRRRDTPRRPPLACTIASFLCATICPSWWCKIAARDSGKRRGRKVSWPRRKDRRSCPRTKRTGSGPLRRIHRSKPRRTAPRCAPFWKT
jgi:hypothetical protein